ncbi:glycosyltransferase family 2 protein [Roseobacter sp. HKCCD5988]|uniref:glycosyltransferase family 2 protein n=1 Tax=Roseobacter sp. HKCCD5988 TaxID=3120338 RepID=UPI0030ECAE42
MKRTRSKDLVAVDIVSPCFNEREGILDFFNELVAINASREVPFFVNLIIVDDGSTDGSWEIIKNIKENSHVVIEKVRLSRNFGHQAALWCGLERSRSEFVGVIDIDLQDPLLVLFEMFDELRANGEVEVVYGDRLSREGETYAKLVTASVFYKFMKKLSGHNFNVQKGDFRVMKRPVVNALVRVKDYHVFTRGLVPWLGFNQLPHGYHRRERLSGNSKFTINKMLMLARNGLLSFSLAPLNALFFLGVSVVSLSLSFVIYALLSRLFTDVWVPGWTLMFIVNTMFSGLIMAALGVLGQYVGMIFEQSKGRPVYIVKEIIDGSSEHSV